MTWSVIKKQNLAAEARHNSPLAFRPRPALIVSGFLVIVLLAAIMYITWARKTVILVESGQESTVKTWSFNVGKLLQEQKIELGPEDKITPDLSSQLYEGCRVEIKRAHLITLTVDKKTTEFYSTGLTVGDVLKEKDITVNDQDLVSPPLLDKITAPVAVKVTRVRVAEESSSEVIPFEIRRVPDPEMAKGFSRTVKAGKNGEEVLTWRVVYHDDQETGRDLIERKVSVEPVEAVVNVGTGQTISRGSELIRFKEAMEVTATAYTYTGNNTACGTVPCYGTVAVDPRKIPFGTRLYIDGYGYATALDRGASIANDRIDVFLESESEAYRWGVRRVKIYILD